MSYIIQKSRVASVTINGEDVTSSMVSFNASDASANKNGFVSTTGTLVLGQRPSGADITTYVRRTYKRGEVVILDMQHADGTVYRHPRGYLYVISSSYNVEAEERVIELGCRLELARITDDESGLLSYAQVPLDESRKTLSNISGSLQARGKYLYQKNDGSLQVNNYFNDNESAVEAGVWTSVLGVTAITASPAVSGGAIPDRIKLSFSYPVDEVEEDETGKIDTVDETSTYWINYPVINYERKPIGSEIGDEAIEDCEEENCGGFPDDEECVEAPCEPAEPEPSPVVTDPGGTDFLRPPARPAGGCGNTPVAPPGSAPEPDPEADEEPRPENQPPPSACDENWVTVSTPTYLSATNRRLQKTYYDAPGAQVSRVVTQVWGPSVETNNQYWADSFAYCRNFYGRNCVPNGNCPYDGMQQVLQSETHSTNYYGEANELVQTVTDTYVTTMSAAQPSNWRSGVENGVAEDFRPLDLNEMYRSNRTVQEYWVENNVNYERTTNYDSITSRSVGIKAGPIDCMINGIITTTLRASSTTGTVPLRPDNLNSGSTSTEDAEITIVMGTSREYLNSPSEAGPYDLEESMPVPLLYESRSTIRGIAVRYGNYLKRMVKGQSRALSIGEAMRAEIVDNWYPSMPFRFVDPSSNDIIALRMDGTAWGVSQEESGFVTTGVYLGASSGTYTPGSNVVGNSTPTIQNSGDISSGGTGGTPSTPSTPTPPSIADDVVGQDFAFVVDVEFNFGGNPDTYGTDGIVAAPIKPAEARYQSNLQYFAKGLIVETGGLVSPLGNGGIPITAGGSLVVQGAVIVNADLFASA